MSDIFRQIVEHDQHCKIHSSIYKFFQLFFVAALDINTKTPLDRCVLILWMIILCNKNVQLLFRLQMDYKLRLEDKIWQCFVCLNLKNWKLQQKNLSPS